MRKTSKKLWGADCIYTYQYKNRNPFTGVIGDTYHLVPAVRYVKHQKTAYVVVTCSPEVGNGIWELHPLGVWDAVENKTLTFEEYSNRPDIDRQNTQALCDINRRYSWVYLHWMTWNNNGMQCYYIDTKYATKICDLDRFKEVSKEKDDKYSAHINAIFKQQCDWVDGKVYNHGYIYNADPDWMIKTRRKRNEIDC